MSGGLFVTGTDTGVGKTVVGCALARALRRRHRDVGVMKPVETGVGAQGPLDAICLVEAAEVDDPLDLVCPQSFALPAAPTVAARVEGRQVDLQAIRKSFRTLRERHELLLVEGAGGLLAPAAIGVSMAELAAEFGLPLLVVARASLGTINHTLLTLEACTARQLPLAGVVISHATGPLSHADAENLRALREALGERLRGEIPPLGPDDQPAADALDVEGLLAAATVQGGERSLPS